MTWHCSRWIDNLNNSGEICEENPIDDLYRQFHCTRFQRSGWFIVDHNDNPVESEPDGEAECTGHDRLADWREVSTPTIMADLEDSDRYVCHDCELVWDDFDLFNEHIVDVHQQDTETENTENYIPEIRTSDGRVLSRWNFELQRYEAVTPTTHTNWSQA